MSNVNFCLTISKDITGKTLQFNSTKALQDWLAQEQQAYQWISQVGKNFSRNLWSHVSSQFLEATSQIDSINQNIAKVQPFDGHINTLNSWFSSTYSRNKKLVLTTSSEFKAVIDLKESSPIKAAVFLAHILSRPHLYQNGVETIEMLEGSYEYFQYKKGVSKKDLSAEKQALEELKKDWDQHLTDYKANEDKLETEFENIKTNFDKYFKDTQNNILEHLTKHTADLDDLKKTYDQFMSLKAPVDYWFQKSKDHSASVSKFRNWTLGVGTLGGITLLGLMYCAAFSDTAINYWKVGFFVVLATLYFWTMRVLVKLLLSNIHLEGDANERVVMSQTYLALLREQSGLNDNDKKLILSTLFRPSSSGIVGDDGIPPGIYDIATKLVSR